MLAPPVVVHDRPPLALTDAVDSPATRGATSALPFWKMSGSGNDFVFLDARQGALPDAVTGPDGVRRLCARGPGIGADGVVILDPAPPGHLRIRYFNADGSAADLCGNATLCTARLGALLGAVPSDGMVIETGAGTVPARLVDGEPELVLGPVTTLRPDEPSTPTVPGEHRIGYAVVGVPHLVVLVDDLEAVPLGARGPILRHTPALPGGANVNWVAQTPAGWAMRTFERGVEGETLACGTGSVAVGLLLAAWGIANLPVRIMTRSGRWVTVSTAREGDSVRPTLRGEGRLVFRGVLEEA